MTRNIIGVSTHVVFGVPVYGWCCTAEEIVNMGNAKRGVGNSENRENEADEGVDMQENNSQRRWYSRTRRTDTSDTPRLTKASKRSHERTGFLKCCALPLYPLHSYFERVCAGDGGKNNEDNKRISITQI